MIETRFVTNRRACIYWRLFGKWIRSACVMPNDKPAVISGCDDHSLLFLDFNTSYFISFFSVKHLCCLRWFNTSQFNTNVWRNRFLNHCTSQADAFTYFLFIQCMGNKILKNSVFFQPKNSVPYLYWSIHSIFILFRIRAKKKNHS